MFIKVISKDAYAELKGEQVLWRRGLTDRPALGVGFPINNDTHGNTDLEF